MMTVNSLPQYNYRFMMDEVVVVLREGRTTQEASFVSPSKDDKGSFSCELCTCILFCAHLSVS